MQEKYILQKAFQALARNWPLNQSWSTVQIIKHVKTVSNFETWMNLIEGF